MLHAVQILLLEGWAEGIVFILDSVKVCVERIPAKINQRGPTAVKCHQRQGCPGQGPQAAPTIALR